jgi:hypothetical protein
LLPNKSTSTFSLSGCIFSSNLLFVEVLELLCKLVFFSKHALQFKKLFSFSNVQLLQIHFDKSSEVLYEVESLITADVLFVNVVNLFSVIVLFSPTEESLVESHIIQTTLSQSLSNVQTVQVQPLLAVLSIELLLETLF